MATKDHERQERERGSGTMSNTKMYYNNLGGDGTRVSLGICIILSYYPYSLTLLLVLGSELE